MQRHRVLFVFWLAAASPLLSQAPVPAPVKAAAERITTEQLKTDLEFFASDELKGRNTPSPGFDAAAAYIEGRLQRVGVKPAGDNGSYRQHYVMRETRLQGDASALVIGERSFKLGDDFALRSFAGAFTANTARAVYVGHGWTADGVDPYRGVDVEGKFVVVHAQTARPKGVEIRQLGRVSIGGSSPLVEAQRRGALGVIYLATGPLARPGGRGDARPTVRRELEPGVPSAYAAPVLTSIQLGEDATRELLEGSKLDASQLAEQAKAQNFVSSFELPRSVSLRLPATTVDHRPFNVVAVIEGMDPALKDEYIVVQSHLDGAVGTRVVDNDGIYNSADDNATGSAANLAIAEQMMTVRPKRSLIFVWDSGEEQGLWGTRHFVANPPVPLQKIVAMFNIDMIGANRAPGSADADEERVTGPNEVFLIGPGILSNRAAALIERVNDTYLELSLNRKYDTPASEFFYPRTDAGPFLERGILTIGFTTGIHDRYHLPADEARFMDPAKMTAIARTIFATVHALAETPERPGIDKAIPETVPRYR
jgi:Zn-dependent M28 family amino/carboxypeptidase